MSLFKKIPLSFNAFINTSYGRLIASGPLKMTLHTLTLETDQSSVGTLIDSALWDMLMFVLQNVSYNSLVPIFKVKLTKEIVHACT